MKAADLFKKTLKHLLDIKPRGTQSMIADQLNIPRTSLNDYLNRDRSLSEDKREQIAVFLGYKYEEFLALGRQLFDPQTDNAMPIEEPPISLKDLIPDLKKLSANDLKIIAELLKRFTQ